MIVSETYQIKFYIYSKKNPTNHRKTNQQTKTTNKTGCMGSVRILPPAPSILFAFSAITEGVLRNVLCKT